MSVEDAKKKAGYAAVDEYVKDGMLVGVGSGSTVAYVAERLGQLIAEKGWQVKCVPTSFQSYQLCVEYKLPLTNLDENPILDIDIDGADEVDSDLNLIKGGGGCLLQEKVVADAASKLVIVADFRKDSKQLGEKWKKGIPVEVVPLAYVPVMKKLEAMGGKAVLRMAVAKAGPLVTDNGNFIVDVDFGEIPPAKVEELDQRINLIPGVVETGFFVQRASVVYFGMEDGSVKKVEK